VINRERTVQGARDRAKKDTGMLDSGQPAQPTTRRRSARAQRRRAPLSEWTRTADLAEMRAIPPFRLRSPVESRPSRIDLREGGQTLPKVTLMIIKHTTAALALCASLAVFGCKTADGGAQTGTTINKAADQVDLAISQLDTTVAALHSMIERPAPDLTVQRDAFEKSLSALESTAKDVSDSSAEMQANGQAYFAKWNEQVESIHNEDIREQSEDRKKTLQASYDKAQKEFGETKSSFDAVLSDLRDIRTALRADLTMHGLDALKSSVKRVDKNAEKSKDSLKDLSARFREVGAELSRSGPPEPPQ
jgi:hypothetical protein